MSDDSDREPSAQESDHNDDLVGGAWEEEDEEEEEERRPSSRGKAVEREVSILLFPQTFCTSKLTVGFCDCFLM